MNVSTTLRKLLTPEARRIFSSIYGHLLATADSTPCRTVLICSASTGEGATFVAAGLALAAAEEHASQVLLIDGNFHNPRVSEIFGLRDDFGLGNLLATNADMNSVIKKTPIANLSLIGVGAILSDRLKALESPKFRNLLRQLAEIYQFIFVDGPAINAHTESLLYASQVDRVLLVVRAGVARVPVVNKALSELSAAECEKVEFILNRRTFVIPQAIYEKL